MDKTKKRRIQILAASVFWLGVWQAAAVAIGQEVFLVSPVQAIGTLVELLPQAEFWQRIGFSAGRILLGFGLGVLSSAVLAVAAEKWVWVDALLAPVMQLVKATPVASFIILALVWVSGSSLSVLISFLMVLPVLYSAVRTGIGSADRQLLEMAQVFRLPLGRRLRAVWLPAVLPAFRQGCSVALGICWKSGVAAEVIGLGRLAPAAWRPEHRRVVHSKREVLEEDFLSESFRQILYFQFVVGFTHFSAPSSPRTAATALSSSTRNSFSNTALSRMMTKVQANSSPVERVIFAR